MELLDNLIGAGAIAMGAMMPHEEILDPGASSIHPFLGSQGALPAKTNWMHDLPDAIYAGILVLALIGM
eukprot:1440361-Prymnesium_polylepis.1